MIDVLLEKIKDLLVVVGHEKSKIINLINNHIKIVNNIDYEKGMDIYFTAMGYSKIIFKVS